MSWKPNLLNPNKVFVLCLEPQILHLTRKGREVLTQPLTWVETHIFCAPILMCHSIVERFLIPNLEQTSIQTIPWTGFVLTKCPPSFAPEAILENLNGSPPHGFNYNMPTLLKKMSDNLFSGIDGSPTHNPLAERLMHLEHLQQIQFKFLRQS